VSVARRPPGPKGRFLRGSVPEIRRDTEGLPGFLTRCARDYGDVVGFSLFRVRYCLVNDPTLIERVLVHEHDHVIKHGDLRQLKPALGDGLLTNEGDAWRRQRRLVQPAFSHECIRTYADITVRSSEQMLTSWRDGDVHDVHADLMSVTLQIVAQALFGVNMALQERAVGAALRGFMDLLEQAAGGRFPLWVPTPANRRLRRAIRRFDALISSVIRERRASGGQGTDLLSLLLTTADETGAGMTDREVRDEVITLLFAGHETTGLALSWTLFLLGQHPEIEVKLARELETVLGGRTPTAADAPKLAYARQVLQEALRLYPPVWCFGREAQATIQLGDYFIPRGTQILLAQWVTHRDARFFPEPERFLPERWEPERERRIPNYAYFPFGGGPRRCIGSNVAMMEATLLLAIVVQRFRVVLQLEHPVELDPGITLRPRHGIRVTVWHRGAGATSAA